MLTQIPFNSRSLRLMSLHRRGKSQVVQRPYPFLGDQPDERRRQSCLGTGGRPDDHENHPRETDSGSWVCGRLNGHRFEALVFPVHAENSEWELGDSRISKLFVQRLADHQAVVNFDRGWDVRPTTDEARAIVDFLAAGLAEHILGSGA